MSSVVGPDGVRCQTTVQGQPTSVPHDGGQVAVSVSAARDCTWDASTDASWMQLSSTSGQGDATFTATVSANDRGTSRSGAVVVNDQRLTVSQEPRPCPWDLRPSPERISSAGGRGNIRVETSTGCAWTASSSAAWLRVLTPSGEGPGDVAIEAEANSGPPRDASVTIGGRPVAILQNGAGDTPAPQPDCTATVSPSTLPAPAAGGALTVTLGIAAACDWAASSTAPWVTVGATAGRGPATVELTVAANAGGARSAAITIAGQTVTVNQEARPPCTYSIDDGARSFPAAGGEGRVRVTTQSGCAWTVSGAPSWIDVGGGQRTGNGDVRYTVEANTAASSRSATLTIAGRSHRVTQDAAAPSCTFDVEPASAGMSAAGGNGQFSVETSAGCEWTASSDAAWAVVNTPGGTGPGQVTYRVEANAASSQRTARITVNGRTHTVTQAAAAPSCTYRVDPPSASFGAAGGNGQFQVITDAGCAWTASSSAGWTVVNTSSGSGSGSITYRVDANGADAPRSATISVNGQTHAVSQEALTPTCTFGVDPASATFGAGGGSGQFTVTTADGCAWSASSDAGWAAVSTSSGSGPGQVTYRVDPNAATSPRTARITVNGQTHTVSQDAAAPTCTYSLQPGSASFAASGGSGQFSVVTEAGCAWTASGGAGWTIVSNGAGTGPGQVVYSVAPNSASSPRSATITVNGQPHTVTQDGAAPPPPPPVCSYSIEPDERTFGEEGGEGTVRVTTEATCSWTASTGAPWITLGSSGGTGPGELRYTVAVNAGGDREATIAVAGRTHEVRQQGDDDDLHAFLTVRLPYDRPGGSYCRSCSAQSSFSRY